MLLYTYNMIFDLFLSEFIAQRKIKFRLFRFFLSPPKHEPNNRNCFYMDIKILYLSLIYQNRKIFRIVTVDTRARVFY